MPKPKTGSLRKRSAGVWELCVTQKSNDGQQKRRYETFRGNKAEAEAYLRAMQVADDRGQLPTTNITLSAWMDHWSAEAAGHCPGLQLGRGTPYQAQHRPPEVGQSDRDGPTRICGGLAGTPETQER